MSVKACCVRNTWIIKQTNEWKHPSLAGLRHYHSGHCALKSSKQPFPPEWKSTMRHKTQKRTQNKKKGMQFLPLFTNAFSGPWDNLQVEPCSAPCTLLRLSTEQAGPISTNSHTALLEKRHESGLRISWTHYSWQSFLTWEQLLASSKVLIFALMAN